MCPEGEETGKGVILCASLSVEAQAITVTRQAFYHLRLIRQLIPDS